MAALVKYLKKGLVPFFLLAALYACTPDVEKIQTIIQANDSLMPQTADTVEIIYSDSGRVKAILQAPLMEKYRGEEQVLEMKRGVSARFLNSEGKEENYLSAGYGIHYPHKRLITLRYAVNVSSSKGERLETEELHWNQETGKIYTAKHVKITTPDEVIFGDGFESNQNFTEYKIFKIRGTAKLKDEKINPDN